VNTLVLIQRPRKDDEANRKVVPPVSNT